jgi:hypothetical protein
MIPTLAVLLRVAGAGLLLLAAVHVPLARHLKWREQALLLTPLNGAIFRVHNLFIQVILLVMALPCLLDPRSFLDISRAGAWMSSSFAAFWAVRLYCQWFVYEKTLWRAKRFETSIHWLFSFVWLSLAALFGICASRQVGWIS